MLRSRNSLLWLTGAAAVGACLPAAAQVFFTEDEALRTVFGADATIRREEKRLDEAARRELGDKTGLRFSDSAVIFNAERNGKLAGYAMVMEEIGKSEPITFLVGITPEGKVLDVVVMVFRESRGWEVRDKRFLRQFRGKTSASPLRVNDDVLNYSGATLSSKAIARGVKKALTLVEHFYALPATKGPRGELRLAPHSLGERVGDSAGLCRQMRYRMGTLCEVRLAAETEGEAARALGVAFGELSRLENVFSNYRADSELALVNQEAGHAAVRVSPEFWQLLTQAKRAAEESQGAVDATVGPLLEAWGFQRGAFREPTANELREALNRVGMDKVLLDRRRHTIRFAAPGMRLDFGGFAKGFAADCVRTLLQAAGIRRGVVNLGGSSIALWGNRERGGLQPWVIGVADPASTGLGVLFEMHGEQSLSTSGTSERSFAHNGGIVSHLIHPRTGQPLRGQQSATVLAQSGVVAEAESKRLLLDATWEGPIQRDWVRLRGDSARSTRDGRVQHTVELVPAKNFA